MNLCTYIFKPTVIISNLTKLCVTSIAFVTLLILLLIKGKNNVLVK